MRYHKSQIIQRNLVSDTEITSFLSNILRANSDFFQSMFIYKLYHIISSHIIPDAVGAYS
jgi:hypothetical protein